MEKHIGQYIQDVVARHISGSPKMCYAIALDVLNALKEKVELPNSIEVPDVKKEKPKEEKSLEGEAPSIDSVVGKGVVDPVKKNESYTTPDKLEVRSEDVNKGLASAKVVEGIKETVKPKRKEKKTNFFGRKSYPKSKK